MKPTLATMAWPESKKVVDGCIVVYRTWNFVVLILLLGAIDQHYWA